MGTTHFCPGPFLMQLHFPGPGDSRAAHAGMTGPAHLIRTPPCCAAVLRAVHTQQLTHRGGSPCPRSPQDRGRNRFPS